MLTGPAEIVVFAGPSLPSPWRPHDGRLCWRGPAAAGDVLAMLNRPPHAAVLIDGVFDATPAVRHKEILALMARGTRVLGAASMGALRAAELGAFGMRGWGRIHAAFQAGRLWGDDEVALGHGPAELDWPSLSEPLVNVRATLLAARRAQVIDRAAARALFRAAGAIFYQDRTWPAVLQEAGELQSGRFAVWLEQGRVDLKRQDALGCVRFALGLAATEERRPEPPATLFTAALAERTGA